MNIVRHGQYHPESLTNNNNKNRDNNPSGFQFKVQVKINQDVETHSITKKDLESKE